MLGAVDLEYVRGDRPLFSHLSFSLKPGELLHVTGTNGNGKPALLRTLCDLTSARAAEVRWHVNDINKLGDDHHTQLAHVGHANGIPGGLTTVENLSVASSVNGDTDKSRK